MQSSGEGSVLNQKTPWNFSGNPWSRGCEREKARKLPKKCEDWDSGSRILSTLWGCFSKLQAMGSMGHGLALMDHKVPQWTLWYIPKRFSLLRTGIVGGILPVPQSCVRTQSALAGGMMLLRELGPPKIWYIYLYRHHSFAWETSHFNEWKSTCYTVGYKPKTRLFSHAWFCVTRLISFPIRWQPHLRWCADSLAHFEINWLPWSHLGKTRSTYIQQSTARKS